MEGALLQHTVDRLAAGSHHVSVLATPGAPRGDPPPPGQGPPPRDAPTSARSHSAVAGGRDGLRPAPSAGGHSRGNFAPISQQLAQVPRPLAAPSSNPLLQCH